MPVCYLEICYSDNWAHNLLLTLMSKLCTTEALSPLMKLCVCKLFWNVTPCNISFGIWWTGNLTFTSAVNLRIWLLVESANPFHQGRRIHKTSTKCHLEFLKWLEISRLHIKIPTFVSKFWFFRKFPTLVWQKMDFVIFYFFKEKDGTS